MVVQYSFEIGVWNNDTTIQSVKLFIYSQNLPTKLIFWKSNRNGIRDCQLLFDSIIQKFSFPVPKGNALPLRSGVVTGEGGGEDGTPSSFVAKVTSYLVTFIRIPHNLYFIYPI